MPFIRIVLSLSVVPFVLSAADIDEAIKLFNALQFDRARDAFAEIVAAGSDPRIAEAYYYMGRLSINPDSQLAYYRTVTRNYPQSRYADIALLEVAKINFGRESYETAVLTLSELITNYPETKIREEYLFWLGASQIALGQDDAGVKSLKMLIDSYPNSSWSERARDILSNQSAPSPEYYTIQIASYRSNENASKNAADLKSQGYEVSVVEASVKGTTYYRVWVGHFATKEEAKEFQKKLQAAGIKGNIVKGY